MKQLTSKQCKCLMIFYVCLNKIMLLPSLICSNMGKDFWLVLLFAFGFEMLFLLMILNLSKENPDLTIKQRMERVFGKGFTKIFYFLIGILLLFKVTIAMHECYIYLFDSLYANYNWIEMLIPLCIFLIYIGAKSFTNFGRSIEIIKYIIYACIIISLFDALPNINFISLMPVMKTSIQRVLSTSFNFSLWFGDFIILYFMIGDIKVNKKMHKDIIKGWIIGAGITIITAVFFYMSYGIISPLRRMAIIDITQFVPKVSNSSNFAWIVTSSWTIAVIFNLSLLIYLINQSFAITFSIKDDYRKILSFIVVISVLVVLILFNFRLNNMMNILNIVFKYYVFVVQYILTLIVIPIMSIKFKKSLEKRRFKYVK